MAKQRKTRRDSALSNARLKALARRYESAVKDYARRDDARLKLARQLHDLAIRSGQSELRIDVHRLDRPTAKPETQRYKLGDSRASLAKMVRFCNILVPVPLPVCIAAGCRIFIPLAPPFLLGCFLIACEVNVCRFPPRLVCTYLCI